jgi:hypothetical protein
VFEGKEMMNSSSSVMLFIPLLHSSSPSFLKFFLEAPNINTRNNKEDLRGRKREGIKEKVGEKKPKLKWGKFNI